jgi:hypothetical protein
VKIIGKNPKFLSNMLQRLQHQFNGHVKKHCYKLVNNLWQETVVLNLYQMDNHTTGVGTMYPTVLLTVRKIEDVPNIYLKMPYLEKLETTLYNNEKYSCKTILWDKPRSSVKVREDL